VTTYITFGTTRRLYCRNSVLQRCFLHCFANILGFNGSWDLYGPESKSYLH
jgi:hypothetical protein